LGGLDERKENLPFIVLFCARAAADDFLGLMLQVDGTRTVLLPAGVNIALAQKALAAKRAPLFEIVSRA